MLTLVFFLRQYKHYLVDRKLTVSVHYPSLLWLWNFECDEGHGVHWQEILQERLSLSKPL